MDYLPALWCLYYCFDLTKKDAAREMGLKAPYAKFNRLEYLIENDFEYMEDIIRRADLAHGTNVISYWEWYYKGGPDPIMAKVNEVIESGGQLSII